MKSAQGEKIFKKPFPISPDYRAALPILVTAADSTGSVAVIRSLGRAGYPVHAASEKADALGFFSSFTRVAVRHPKYNTLEFLEWFTHYVAEHKIAAVIPSEGFLLALRPRFNEFSRLLPLPSDERLVYAALSKADTYKILVEQGGGAAAKLPRSLIIERGEKIPDVSSLETLRKPLFLKVDGCYSFHGEGGQVFEVADATEARGKLPNLLDRYEKVLIQEYVAGRGCGVFFLVTDNKIRAEFQHQRIHEVPHTGGASSYRISCRDDTLLNDARIKIQAIGWSGVAMLEYRGDKENGFFLMEINCRFWGSLHLALLSGVDFPRLLVDEFLSGFFGAPPEWKTGVKCRLTWPREAQYVMSCLRDRRLGGALRIWSCLDFLLLGLDPTVHSDYAWPGDRQLYWRSFIKFWREFGAGVKRRVRGQNNAI